MLGAQPLTQPLTSVLFHRPIGFTDWTEAEVVGPPNHHAVECAHHRLFIQQGFVPSGFATDRVTDANHPLLSRYGAQKGQPRFRRVAAPERFSSFVTSTTALIATGWSEPVPGRVYPRCGPPPFHGAPGFTVYQALTKVCYQVSAYPVPGADLAPGMAVRRFGFTATPATA